jgi:hypothetical protein
VNGKASRGEAFPLRNNCSWVDGLGWTARASVGLLPSRPANLPPPRCQAGPREERPACQSHVVGGEVADLLGAPRGSRWPVGLKGSQAVAPPGKLRANAGVDWLVGGEEGSGWGPRLTPLDLHPATATATANRKGTYVGRPRGSDVAGGVALRCVSCVWLLRGEAGRPSRA